LYKYFGFVERYDWLQITMPHAHFSTCSIALKDFSGYILYSCFRRGYK